MLTCSYDNSTCYKIKSVPVITDVSANSGYTSGGQTFKISGYGFESNDISVKIDGTTCDVQEHTQESLTCWTKASPASDTTLQYVGSNGLEWHFYNNSNGVGPIADLQTQTPQISRIALSTELPINV
jgi:hypothetical protein